MFKKAVSFFVVFALLIGFIPTNVFATEKNDEIEYGIIANELPEDTHSDDITTEMTNYQLHQANEEEYSLNSTEVALRYTVLVLETDNGFSLQSNGETFFEADTPIEEVQAAAREFLEQISNATGINHIAIVSFASEAQVVSDFSTDITYLNGIVDRLEEESGYININAALQTASELLGNVDNSEAIKNIVVFTQGVPGEGDYSSTGRYSIEDCKWKRPDNDIHIYEYANAAYDTAKQLMNEYNIYSVGLFQEMLDVPEKGKPVLEFARRFTEDIQNAGYQEVENVDDLEFAFGDIADSIASTSREAWITAHRNYAESDNFKTQVVQGFSGELQTVFEEIKENGSIDLYNTLDSINDVLDFDLDLTDSQEYELLLAQILFTRNGVTSIEKIYDEYLPDAVVQFAEVLLDVPEFVADLDEEKLNSYKKAIDTVKNLAKGTVEYQKAFDSLLNQFDLMGDFYFADSFLEACDNAKFKFSAGLFADQFFTTCDSLKQLVMYMAAAESYCDTADAFGDMLLSLRKRIAVPSDDDRFAPYPSEEMIVSDTEIWIKLGVKNAGTPIGPDPLNCPVHLSVLAQAIEDFYLSLDSSKMGDADYIASKIGADYAEATLDNLLDTQVDVALSLFECIPVVKAFDTIRKLFDGTQFVIDNFTAIDDQAYHGTMVKRLYAIAYIHYKTVVSYASGDWDTLPLLYSGTLEEYQFDRATYFDEAVTVYRAILSTAADYAIEYKSAFYNMIDDLLIEPAKYNYPNVLPNANTAVGRLQSQKINLSSVWCHRNLIIDSIKNKTYDSSDLLIYSLKCPIVVTVRNEIGNIIATLSDDKSDIASGYEHYFYVSETFNGSGEYIKIAIVPDTYEVTITGIGTGSMDAMVSIYTNEKLSDTEYFFDIPITDNTEGIFMDSSDEDGMKDLEIAGVNFSGESDVHIHEYITPEYIWTEDHTCEAIFACKDGDFIYTVNCTVTSDTIPATESNDGLTVFTATVEFNGQTHTNTKTVVIPATGHVAHTTTLVPATEASCNHSGNTAYYTCSDCDLWFEDADGQMIIEDHESVIIPKLRHDFQDGVCILCGAKWYAGGACGENLEWVLTEDGTLNIWGTGAMDDYDDESDTPWYSFRKQITSVDINNGVTRIGNNAFNYCTNLVGITIGNSVTSIGTGAFYDCHNLSSVILPNSVSAIERYAFCNCRKLSIVEIPDSVTSIGDYAFYYCNKLSTVELPDSVSSIGSSTFCKCNSLTGFLVDKNNPYYSNDSRGVLYNKQKTSLIRAPGAISGSYSIPDGVFSICNNAFEFCNGLTNVTIPNSANFIGDFSFAYCDGLTSIVIPDNVSSIGSYAFESCDSLGNVLIGDGVSSIGSYAFYGCDSLTNVVIGENVSSIGNGVFSYCTRLSSIIIPDDVSDIGSDAFNSCESLVDVVIGEGVLSIGSQAFYRCGSLTNIVIPDGVASIGYGAFAYCSGLTEVMIPKSISSIGNNAFAWCHNLTGIYVDNRNLVYSNDERGVLFDKEKVRLIQAPCSISGSYVIPDNVVDINTFAFGFCSSLIDVVIPDSVKSIGNDAFFNCSSLNEIIFQGDAPTIGTSVFEFVSATAYYPADNPTWTGDIRKNYGGTITWVPYSTAAEIASGWSGDTTWVLTSDGVLTFSGSGKMKNYDYGGSRPWDAYADLITSVVIEEGITRVGNCAFMGTTNLESVTLPESLTHMGEAAFYGTGLTSVEIPAALYTIQPYTFKNCVNLNSVTFHEGNIQKISDGAFYGTGLTEVVLPDCLDILDTFAFKGCANLTSITIGSGLTELREAVFYGTAIPTIEIPEGITKIGPYAFKNCIALETIDLPSTLTSVGEASFYACTALKTVELPDEVTEVGNYAFRKCAAIESLVLGEELTTVGECAFYGCTGLTELVIPDQVTTIKPYAFKTCTGLTSVTLGSRVETIGEGAFNTCTGIKTIIFPASVKSISDYAFANSANLWQLTFTGDAPSIGTGAFKGLNAYGYYPSGNDTWTTDVMQNYGGIITWNEN